MARFLVVTWGLVLGWFWWIVGARSGSSALAGGIVLGAVTIGLAMGMAQRSRRLRADHEHVNARLEYHAGSSSRVWKRSRPARGDDGGAEFTLGAGH